MDPKTRLDDRRAVPAFLQKALALDVDLTKRFVSFSLNFVPVRSLKTHCKFLEYSCHGVVWLAGLLAICWFLDNPDYYEAQMNLLFGLILDIVLVAGIKAFTRRRRPTIDDGLFTFGPDKFSFPSGHASRAFFVLMFFTVLNPVSVIFWPPLLAWACSVALSRLLMYRHHILDVIAGISLGCNEAIIISVLWLNKGTASWVMSWLSDEKLPGGEIQ